MLTPPLPHLPLPQPLIRYPSRQGGTGKFLSQVTRREPPSPRAAHGNDPGDITRDPAAPEPSNSAEAGDQDDPGDVLDNDPGDPNAAEVTEPVAQ